MAVGAPETGWLEAKPHSFTQAGALYYLHDIVSELNFPRVEMNKTPAENRKAA